MSCQHMADALNFLQTLNPTALLIMKKTHKTLLALGALSVGAATPVAFGQAVTIPVGYATTTAAGQYTFMSANLHNAIDWQGLMTGGPLSANAEGDPFVGGAYNQDENSGITKY